MASVKVIIYDPTGIKREVDLPDDVTMRDLIPKIVKRMELPSQDSNGNQLAYRLKHRPSGHQFTADEFLSSIGTAADDKLDVFPSSNISRITS